jgi:hypothetical protein
MRGACIQCGAFDLADIANLSPDTARDVIRRSVHAPLEPGTITGN